MITAQKWNKEVGSELEMGIKYYYLLSIVNSLKLTQREIELLSFTSQRGTISSPTAKGEFCRRFNSSVPTVNNMISKLKSMGYLIKADGRIAVHPKLDFNFSNDFIINITLNGYKTADSV